MGLEYPATMLDLEAQSKNQTVRVVGQPPDLQLQTAASPVGLGTTKSDPKKPLVPKKPPSSSPGSFLKLAHLNVLDFKALGFRVPPSIVCLSLLPLASPLPRDHHPTVLAQRPRTFFTSVSEALTARQVPVSTRAKPTCMYLVFFSGWRKTALTPRNKQLLCLPGNIKSVPQINNHKLSKTRDMLSSNLCSFSYSDDSRSTTAEGMSCSCGFSRVPGLLSAEDAEFRV